MVAAYYEIRVAGMLPSGVLLDFEWLSADLAPVETVLHGLLPDQEALAAFLARMEEFRADVIEIRRLRESGPAARGLMARTRETRDPDLVIDSHHGNSQIPRSFALAALNSSSARMP